MDKKLITGTAATSAAVGAARFAVGKKRREQKVVPNLHSGKSVLILVNHDVAIYNFRLELVERLVSDGYEVHISSPVGNHTDDLKVLGVHFHAIEFDRHGMNPLDELCIIRKYQRLISEVKPLIVFTYTVKCNIYGGIVSRHKHIPFCANITGLGTTVNGGGAKEKLILALYKIGLKGAQQVFFQNEGNKNYMVSCSVISSPCTVIPGSGVNLSTHSYEPYPVDNNGIIISYIGRIMKDKGIDELLVAAKEVIKRRKDVSPGNAPKVIFRLIGFFDGNYKKKVRQVEKQGIIHYIPQQRDIHPWIAESHAIIMPSYHEGMSNVILEAASTGRPVLCSDISGCREAVEDGVSGILFKTRDSCSMVEAIERFLRMSNEERAVMGGFGRKKMEREFNRNIVIDKYMDELKLAEEKV